MSTLNVVLNQLNGTTSVAKARHHSLKIDRPEAKGGQDMGPLGGEVFLMGLGGCLMSNLLAAAKARDIELNEAQISIEAVIGDTPKRITDIEIIISGSVHPKKAFEKVVAIAERGCALVVTLKRATNLRIKIA